MIINQYVRPYLDFYGQLNLLGMGTIYKTAVNVTKEGKVLHPASFKFKLDHLVSENIDHFILFISQYEKGTFESIQKQVYSDFEFCKELLQEDKNINFEGVGSIRNFNRKITLFPESDLHRDFGYPEITVRK